MDSNLGSVHDSDEASDKLSPIQIRKNRLLVLNWETEETEVVAFFENKSAQERPGAFEKALRVGVVASAMVGTAERIDYVQKEFNSLQTRFDRQLETTLKQLGDAFEGQFGDKGRFSQVIEQHFGENGKLMKEIFDPNREGTPLHQLKVDLERQIGDLRDKIAGKTAAEHVAAKTPIHGIDFEKDVEALLSKIVRQRKGDTLEAVGTLPGKLTRSKKGDFLLRFHEKPDAPLVIDTKDEKATSMPEIQRTLGEALENRGAAYAILVSKKREALDDSVGWFNEYGDNHLVVALGDSGSDELKEEILNIAVTWARFKILLRTAQTAALDVSKIATSVERAEMILGRFRDIMTQCTNLEKASQAIRDVCEEIKRDLHNELRTITTLVNTPQA